ncbi:MAG TPA: TIR domain-containing protein [Vicinamibacterales bacterium]|nr:TIR domain-containing protein [Vicinamibacterales bacterium]
MSPDRAGAFISYARSDGEALAKDVSARLHDEGISLWRDLDRLEGGRDWWLQITAALDQVEFLVVIMTPAATQSELVRREWRYARQRGVCVYPVKATENTDFDSLPRWMRSVHFYDLDREWAKFVNDLRTRCRSVRVPFMAEDLPSEFVSRPAEYERLRRHLLDPARQEPLALTTAVRGAGGYGKTVLARALCHDEDIQNAFDDGVLWVTLGEKPGDLTGRVEDLIYFLSGQRPTFASVEAATALFVELLADRDILLVIDDVWDGADLRPFVQGGPRCARVITTRLMDVLPADAQRVDVDAMQPSEATALLGYGLPSGCEDLLQPLAARLGEWPLLLTLLNAALRDRVAAGRQPLSAAIAYVNKALTKRGLTAFDARDSTARHQAVTKTVDLSLERLDMNERARFAELAVFPDDAAIPLVTVERLWARTGPLDEIDTENLCERLNRLSLLLAFDVAQRYIRLHDVIRALLLRQLGPRIVQLHRELLEAHRPESGEWAELPSGEPYLWDHLAGHLIDAGAVTQLIATVLGGRYLAAKTFVRRASATENDLRAAERCEPANMTLRALRRSFVQCSHLLNRCATLNDIAVAFHSRIQDVPELAAVAKALVASMPNPYLRALYPFPDLPHPALIRTLSGGTSTVWSCAVSPDGAFVVTAHYDGILIVWDASTGVERHRLSGHASWVRGCAVSPDSTFIVSASFDRRAHVWNAATGELIRVLSGHTDGVTHCAVAPDNRMIVTASLDASIRIWDVATGNPVRTIAEQWAETKGGWLESRFGGHLAAVWHCAISPDGSCLVSASSDQTLKVWQIATGKELRTLAGHTAAVQGCAFSRDGNLIASAGGDGDLRIWEAASGAVRLAIHVDGGPLTSCVFTADNNSVVVGCSDGFVRIYDVQTGDEQARYSGHTDIVNHCAVSDDGAFIVSASMDATAKLWDRSLSSRPSWDRSARGWINACARGQDDLIVTGGADAQSHIWDAATGTVRQTLIGHSQSVRACAVSPDSRRVATGSADKSVRVWNVRTGAVDAVLHGHRDWVNCCDISPDGTLLISGSADKTLRVWDLVSGTRRLTITAHTDSVNQCRFSRDGQFFVTTSSDGAMKLWRVEAVREAWESPSVDGLTTVDEWNRKLMPLTLAGHATSVDDCVIGNDSSCLVSASSDGTIRVWNAAAGALRLTISAHDRHVTGCSISPDDRRLASVSSDSTLKVWDLRNGHCVVTLHVDSPLLQCAWLSDGQRLVAVGGGGVYFVELTSPVAVNRDGLS